jgi:hypothetical protein
MTTLDTNALLYWSDGLPATYLTGTYSTSALLYWSDGLPAQYITIVGATPPATVSAFMTTHTKYWGF